MHYHIISYTSTFVYSGCLIWLLVHTIGSYKYQHNGLIPLCIILLSYYFTQNQLLASPTYDFYKYNLEIIDIILSLQIIPLFYYYIKVSTTNTTLGIKEYMLLLPGTILAFAITLLHYVIGYKNISLYIMEVSEVTNEYMHVYNPIRILATHSFLKREIYEVLIGIQYLSISIILIRRRIRRRFVKPNKSSDLKITRRNVKIIGYLFFVISLIVLHIFIQNYYTEPYLYIATLHLLLLGIFISIISYKAPAYGLIYRNQPGLKYQHHETAVLNEDSSKPVLSRNQILHKIFQDEVINKKLYLQQGLKIDEVAILLNSNRTYVSSMISEMYHTNFPNCINNIRIEYAKQILINNPNIKQEDIALKSGFQNGPSFNRVFKQKEGVPPRTWLKNYINQTSCIPRSYQEAKPAKKEK